MSSAETTAREYSVLPCVSAERSYLWRSSLPELVRVLHQAHYSPTPKLELSAALSMSQVTEGSDLWKLNCVFCESPRVHQFPAFPSSSSVSISSIANRSCSDMRDPQITVQDTVVALIASVTRFSTRVTSSICSTRTSCRLLISRHQNFLCFF